MEGGGGSGASSFQFLPRPPGPCCHLCPSKPGVLFCPTIDQLEPPNVRLYTTLPTGIYQGALGILRPRNSMRSVLRGDKLWDCWSPELSRSVTVLVEGRLDCLLSPADVEAAGRFGAEGARGCVSHCEYRPWMNQSGGSGKPSNTDGPGKSESLLQSLSIISAQKRALG